VFLNVNNGNGQFGLEFEISIVLPKDLD